MPETQPVIIIGAGLSGLLLAQGLRKRQIPFRIYERDSKIASRNQGYRIRLSVEGIEALEQNLSEEQFQKIKRSCGQTTWENNFPRNLSAETGEEIRSIIQPGAASSIKTKYVPLPADRAMLRTFLLEGLQDDVEFEKSFISYQERESGITISFSDGTQVKGALLVGADGTWSNVRKCLLPEQTLLDTEGRLMFGKTEITPEFLKSFSSTAMQGLTLIRDSGLNCLIEPMRFSNEVYEAPPDYVYWVLFLRASEENEKLLRATGTQVLEKAVALTRDWHPSFHGLFARANSKQASMIKVATFNPASMSFQNASAARVTLIGDAVHAMSPTAALGATTALRDAGLLALLLSREVSPTSLRAYEEEMLSYASDAISKTLMGGRALFAMRDFDRLAAIKREDVVIEEQIITQ